jgi:hypothetical protein
LKERSSTGYKNEFEATILFQSCGSEAPPRLVFREALKQGSKSIISGRNLVTAGVSSIQKAEVFNRHWFSPIRITLQEPTFYTDKTGTRKDLHSYFHRPETETGRGVAGMVPTEPALAAGSRRNDIFPT